MPVPEKQFWRLGNVIPALALLGFAAFMLIANHQQSTQQASAYQAEQDANHAATTAALQAYRHVFQHGSLQQRLDHCRERSYDHLPYAAPAQALAITPTRVDAYFYLTGQKRVPEHLVCGSEGLLADSSTPNPYAALVLDEVERASDVDERPRTQNLWGEASAEIRVHGMPDILELFTRPDTGDLVIRRWTRGEQGWVEELQPADAPRPGLAATRSALGENGPP